MGSVPCRLPGKVVSSSPEQAPIGHKSGTNDTIRAQILARKRLFDRHPQLSLQLRFHHEIEVRTLGPLCADKNLVECDDALRFGSFNVSKLTNDEIKRLAGNHAHHCQIIVFDETDRAALKQSLSHYLTTLRISQEIDDRLIKSVQRSAWWRKRIHRHRRTALASVRRRIGMANLRHSYIDRYTLESFRRLEIRKRQYLEETVLQNETGQTRTLAEFYDSSVSNPRIRRIELINRLNGIDEWARENGDAGFMVTLTAPSSMHRYAGKGARLNPNFDGSDPRSVQIYLRKLWADARSHLDKQGISFYGLRVAEPHADGTPHWHMVLYTRPHNVADLKQTLNTFALRKNGTERGAKKHRITFTDEDKTKGSLVVYAVKYISKNVDGHGMVEDEHGKPIESYVENATAWSRTYGIRQFQFIGEPPITIWRDLRRLRDPLPGQPTLEPLRKAARDGDYHTYLKLMGGMGGRKVRPVKRVPSNIDHETGEILSGTEMVLATFLSCDNVLTIVRSAQWTIQQARNAPSPRENRSLHGAEGPIAVGEANAEALGLVSITVPTEKTQMHKQTPEERPPP